MTKKVEEVVETKTTAKKTTPTKPKVVEPNLVKVKSKIGGKKFIAGKWYYFEKDKEIEVTQEVKRVLLEANAIYI